MPGFRYSLPKSSYDWNFTTVNDGNTSQSMEGGWQKQPRGKMLGGSGSLNDMVYSRGHPTDYYEWADLVGHEWNWTDVLPYFMKTEQMTDHRIVNNSELMQYHGRYGEIEVSGADVPDSPNAKLLKAFEELGFDIVDDMTYPYKIGAGMFSHTIRDGRRDSSLTALLNKVQSNNLHVLKSTLVTKILIENNTAVGVRALLNGEELSFFANKEVIISAGTFNSPKLLMLSGIGPKASLKEFGIDVIQELPVGERLNDHVMVIYYIAVQKGICLINERDLSFEMIKYLYNGSGKYAYSDSMGVYLPQRDKDPNVPYFAIYPSCLPQGQLTYDACMQGLGYPSEICMKLKNESEQNELISLAVVLLKPQSRGVVRLASTDPTVDPLIYSGTFNDVSDMEEYPAAVKVALSLVNSTYFKNKSAHVVDMTPGNCKGLEDEEDEVIRCQVRELAMTAWHAVGTCALGGVLDAEMRVRGVSSLRVVDASAMPTVPRGNTNAPVIMMAEKAAHFVKRAYYGADN